MRRPLTPTGTNLLGMVKHLATVTYGYFGDTFGRPYEDSLPWIQEDAEDNADMWATADQSRGEILGLYHRARVHADTTIEALDLGSPGRVPWWSADRAEVTLQRILAHMIAETHRHAGHADILRETIDGSAGLRSGNSNLPPGDARWWRTYRDQLEEVARWWAA